MYKVRFNLGKGEHFMHWQVKCSDTGEVEYYNPQEINLELFGCKLRNQKATAKKIHDGANKSVCAWVDCADVQIQTTTDCVCYQVSYNPKNAPNWVGCGVDVDNQKFSRLLSCGNKLFVADHGEYFLS